MMLTTVPFAGFYCSIHEDELDYTLERLFQDESGNPNEKLNARFAELIDWEKVFEPYAKDYVESFAEIFKIKLKWESMEYNFGTDRLFAHITLKEVRRLRLHVVNEKSFREACRERFTSRSGFISSYSNDPDDWGPMKDWDHNQVGTLVQALADQEAAAGEFSSSATEFNSDCELEIMEGARCNGMIEDWIWNAAKEGPELKRIDKVYTYLREREERKWKMREPNNLTTIERRL